MQIGMYNREDKKMKKILLILGLFFTTMPMNVMHATEIEYDKPPIEQGYAELCSYDENLNLLGCNITPIYEVAAQPFMVTQYRTYTTKGSIYGVSDWYRLSYRVKEITYDVARASGSTCTTKEFVPGYEEFEILNQNVVDRIEYQESMSSKIGNSCDGTSMQASVTGLVIYKPGETGSTRYLVINLTEY